MLEKAKEENQAFHRKQKRKLELLLPTYDGISVWPDKVRKALESGLFEPERGPMAVDGEQLQEVKEAYLRAREFIKQGANLFNPRLLEEIPDCLLNTTFMEYQEEPSTGASRPDMGGSSASGPTSIDPLTKEIVTELEPGSGEAKLAMIHAMLGYHKGEVRAYGGQWSSPRLGLQEGCHHSGLGTGTSHTPSQPANPLGRPGGVHRAGDRGPHCSQETPGH